MPDMLVLSRDRRTGALRMAMELDPAPAPPAPLPRVPVTHVDRGGPAFRAWAAERADDVDWLRGAVGDFLGTHEWEADEARRLDWRLLWEELEAYAYETRCP